MLERRLENGFFLAVLLAASVALIWIVLPFFGAILWGVIAAILFAPFNERLLARMPNRRNTSALITLGVIVAIVVVPATILGALLVQEATTLYDKVRTGQIDFVEIFRHFRLILPDWLDRMLQRVGLADLERMRAHLVSGLTDSFQTVAAQALTIGQGALAFFVTVSVALYLTFFLLRDGRKLGNNLDRAIPLSPQTRHALATRFITVTRATINGSLVVAIVQGMIGGIIFWFLDIPGALLWAVTMAFFSLLPAIGTGLIWVPVSLYLLASGQVWQGVTLIFCGIFIIGMVDNVLRPVLVGRDTRMPDYVVLISTLGGLDIFGFNGIVIGPVIAAVFLSVWEIFSEARIRGNALPETSD